MAKTNIYIRDINFYEKLFKSVQTLWYRKYGVNLSKGEAVVKALILLESELLGDVSNRIEDSGNINDFKRQNIYKYKRVGL